MIRDEEILQLAKEHGAYSKDGKEFAFHHGCELISFAREVKAKAIPAGSILVTAEWILAHTNPPKDGACSVCNPDGKHLIDGFTCTYHRAMAAAE